MSMHNTLIRFRRVMKWFFYAFAVFSMAYVVLGLYISHTVDVICKTSLAFSKKSPGGGFEIYQEYRECNDGQLVENKLYVKGKGETEMIYEVKSREPLIVHVLWKSDNEIDVYVPMVQELVGETKYAISQKVNYIYLKAEGGAKGIAHPYASD